MVNADNLRYAKMALNNGSGAIPALGFGTLIPDPIATRTATKAALEAGFRLLDTAERYRTEKEVGEAMQEVFQAGKIKREEVFVITKLWNTNHRPQRVKPAFEASLEKLQLDYVDLYLIHTPFAFQPGDEQDPRDANGNVIYDQGVTLLDTWRCVESLVDEGKCKAIGLSDVTLDKTKEIFEAARIKPAVVHVESHPYLPQWELLDYCRKNGIVLQAFAALGHSSEPKLLEDPVITAIARRVDKTPAQVLLAWAIQRGTALLTTSKTASRIKENFDVSTIPEDAVREISEGIKSRVRFNAVVETGVPGFIPRAKGGQSPATSSRSASANLIGGSWVEGRGNTSRDIYNPADTTELLAPVREAAPDQVDEACAAAARAFPGWRATPAPDRAHVLFKFRALLEKNWEDLAHSIVRENGKLLSEARGSLRRGLDVVEFACGIPSQMMGQTLTGISRDVDCYTVREPLGVVVGIPPFNFPALIPLWMMSIAVASGNTFLLKPAEKAPLTGTRLVELFAEAGLPPGVVGVVQGSQEVSERLIANPHVQAVSFVGSSAVAESVYRTAAAHGKRVQAHGGAKNHLLVLPDADLVRTLPALIGSCFGSAGQRCLAGSVLVAVGDRVRQDAVVDAFIRSAGELKLGDGLDDTATLCPVVNAREEKRIRAAIERGVTEGARLRLDGRSQTVPHRPRGCFLGPTVFDDVTPEMFVGREEIFGPVVSVMRASDLDAAITLTNRSRYGNTVSLFTQSGAAARIFRERIQVGMLGINVGVPAPMGFFPFGGYKNSIYGDLDAQGADAVAFYTRKKVITERWFGAEAPKDGWV